MDRRTFLTGVGTIGAAAAGGWVTLESSASSARAAGLARASGLAKAGQGGRPRTSGNGGLLAEGLTVGYLPGSAGLLDYAARGQRWDSLATQTRWVRWDPSMAMPVYDPLLSVSIGMLQSAQVAAAPGMLRSLEVVAHFALDGAPYFAPFHAWKYEAAGLKKRATATAPLTFDAAMPDRVGLQVNYALSAESLASNVSNSGTVYLPLGARDGPGSGLYVLAGPSRYTGAQPDMSDYFFSGNLRAPLIRSTTGTPDFDFVTLAIRPAAA